MKPNNTDGVLKGVVILVGTGDDSVSYAQLKLPEMSGFGGFGVKTSDFSRFW